MERTKLRIIIATIWIAGLLVLIAALTALAETVTDKPAEETQTAAEDEAAAVTPEEVAEVIEANTEPAGKKEKKYVKLSVDKEALKEKLTSEAYNVCFNAGTEAPFTGKYWDNHDPG